MPLISSNDIFAGYMDESAVADKLMSQNSKDNAFFRN
jgi:hypothetical protein